MLRQSKNRVRFLLSFLDGSRMIYMAVIIASVSASCCQLYIPWLVHILIDKAVIGKDPALILPTSIKLASAAAGVFLFQTLTQIGSTALGGQARHRIQLALAKAIQAAPFSFRTHQQSAATGSTFTNDVAQMSRFHEVVLPELAVRPLMFACTLLFMLHIFRSITVVALLCIPIYLLPPVFFSKRLREASQRLQDRLSAVSVRAQETLDGDREFKAYNQEGAALKRMTTATQQAYVAMVGSAVLRSLSSLSFVAFWALLSALYYLGARAVLSGSMTLGFLGALITYSQYLRDPISQVSTINAELQSALGASQRALAMFDAAMFVESHDADGISVVSRGDIVFDDVKFSYRDGVELLRGVTFSATVGCWAALVGTSGAGKSTCVHMLLRYIAPRSGVITVGGIDISRFSATALRAHIGAVFQEPFIFYGTIRDNIIFGRQGITDLQLAEATDLADAHDFITALPDSYETVIGERGLSLSGGQRQRLALARALLEYRAVLILDEATSAIDQHAEAAICRRIRAARPSTTVILIAHRLSAVVQSDLTIVLQEGRVIDAGHHSELLLRNAHYKKLYVDDSSLSEREWLTA